MKTLWFIGLQLVSFIHNIIESKVLLIIFPMCITVVALFLFLCYTEIKMNMKKVNTDFVTVCQNARE